MAEWHVFLRFISSEKSKILRGKEAQRGKYSFKQRKYGDNAALSEEKRILYKIILIEREIALFCILLVSSLWNAAI